MNPVHIVEAARPEVGAMPVIARRHLRERLFDVATASNSSSGELQVNPSNSSRANALRVGALVLLGLVAAGGLAFSASRSSPDEGNEISSSTLPVATVAPEAVNNTVVQAAPPTIAATTTVAPIAGSDEAPLLLPPERSRLDALAVERKELGGTSLLLRAPDMTTIALREADGIAPLVPDAVDTDPDATTVPTIPPRQFGGFDVTQPGDPGTYDVGVPCGTLQVREGSGRLPFRPEIVELFNSISLADGSIDITLPQGWGLIDIGPSADQFLLGIPTEIGGRSVTVTLTQYPNGSLAVAAFGDRQYAPITFREQQAWISRNPDVPGEFQLVGMMGTTAFSASARDIALSELDTFMQSLLPGTVDDWITRFGPLGAQEDPDIRTCLEQPVFNVRQAP